MKRKIPKVLAISSGGGHWIQMMRLRGAFDGAEVVFATVREGYKADVGNCKFRLIPDSNRWNKIALLRSAVAIFWVVISERPDVVVTTGAAPGFFAVRFGKWLGARVVWIDSVANAEELSMSGRKAGDFVDLWLTQWPHLSTERGPKCMGSVL